MGLLDAVYNIVEGDVLSSSRGARNLVWRSGIGFQDGVDVAGEEDPLPMEELVEVDCAVSLGFVGRLAAGCHVEESGIVAWNWCSHGIMGVRPQYQDIRLRAVVRIERC